MIITETGMVVIRMILRGDYRTAEIWADMEIEEARIQRVNYWGMPS